MVDGLKRSLSISPSERAQRMRRNLEFSNRLTTLHWAYHVLQDLKRIEKDPRDTSVSTLGFGSNFRVVGIKSTLKSLDFTDVARSYKTAKHRLILLDWGGTLVAEDDKMDNVRAYAMAQGHATRTGPSHELKNVLESVCADPRNSVFVISGKMTDAVSAFFGDVEGLGLAAEHGSYYCMPHAANSKGRHWLVGTGLSDMSWKEPAKLLMDNYTIRTHGSYVEQKGTALIWQFRDADPEFGLAQSRELEDHLKDVMSGYPVAVLRGGGLNDGYIEVRPNGVSKGHFLIHMLEALKVQRRHVEFILAIGDDSSDEPMFESLAHMAKSKLVHKFPVTVGRKPTAATSYVDDPNQVMELLAMLAKSSNQQNDKRFKSALDLPSMAATQRAQFRKDSPKQQVRQSVQSI